LNYNDPELFLKKSLIDRSMGDARQISYILES